MKGRDAKIAEMVINGRPIREVAAEMGVSMRQVFRILAYPEVRALLDQAARAQVRTACLALQQGAKASAGALTAIATDEGLPPGARVAAAGKVLDLALRGIEIEDLQRRLLELEQAVGATAPAKGFTT